MIGRGVVGVLCAVHLRADRLCHLTNEHIVSLEQHSSQAIHYSRPYKFHQPVRGDGLIAPCCGLFTALMSILCIHITPG